MSTQNVLFDAPGPRARVRHLVMTVVGGVFVFGIAFLVIRKLDQQGQLAVLGETGRLQLAFGLFTTIGLAVGA